MRLRDRTRTGWRALEALGLAAALGAPAGAQTVLFEDDFEQGFGNWTMTGLFHGTSEADVCGALVAPFPSRSQAAYYGNPGACDFEGWSVGRLTMTTPIEIPAEASDAWLTFWSYEDTECGSCGWDWRFLYVSTNGGSTWQFLGEATVLQRWYQVGFDLSAYIGQTILVRFEFDPVDPWLNDGLGWMIDDVRITADLCESRSYYCPVTPNSVGPGARIRALGSTSLSSSTDFRILLSGAPPGLSATIYYAHNPAHAPLFDGFLCLGPGATGIQRLAPPMNTDAQGGFTHYVDFDLPPVNGSGPNWILPGSTWYFQVRYRDPLGGPAGINYSDAVQVGFCP